MRKLEERIRIGLHETSKLIPEVGSSVVRRRMKRERIRGMWIGATTVLAVMVLFSPVILLTRTDPGESTSSTSFLSGDTPESSDQADSNRDRFESIVEVEQTGDLIAMDANHAFRSSDGGASWDEILVDGGADLLELADDGRLLAFHKGEELGADLEPKSPVPEGPTAHIYDPVSEQWQISKLPGPESFVEITRPDPSENSGRCSPRDIQWTTGALSVAIGDRYVIAAEQRRIEESGCFESYQFFWTSDDGKTWTITDATELPGYMVGIKWFDGRYVAYGTDGPWFKFDRSMLPRVWSSIDLATWNSVDLDISDLPENAFMWLVPEGDESFGLPEPVESTIVGGTLRLSFPVLLAASDRPESISDMEELRRWVQDNGRDVSDIESALDFLGVEFPLDERELKKVTSYFAPLTSSGRLVAESDDGLTWSSRYEGR